MEERDISRISRGVASSRGGSANVVSFCLRAMEENGRKRVQDWTCGDVRLWLQGKGFSNYSNIFSKDHKIDGKALLAMDESDLRNPPLELKILGDIKRLWLEIDAIQQRNRPTTASFHTPNGYLRRKSVYKIDGVANIGESPYDDIFVSDDDRLDWDIFSAFSNISETGRTLISVVYAFSVFFVTSFVMVFVHDRVPDMKKYPPLPDIVLDNVPLIPWAFEMCEVTALILSVVLAIVIFLHKHRIIVVRRLAALCGTVFLLRCVTMFVTSLSVPGIHLECSGKVSS